VNFKNPLHWSNLSQNAADAVAGLEEDEHGRSGA
jgi:hypothetical protein